MTIELHDHRALVVRLVTIDRIGPNDIHKRKGIHDEL